MVANRLNTLGNMACEPLMAYQPAVVAGAHRADARARLLVANFRRGGCPRFSVSRANFPPSSALFFRFRKHLTCPATPEKIEQRRRPGLVVGGGR